MPPNPNKPEEYYPGYLSSGSINSSILTPVPSPSFNAPEPVPQYDVSALTPPPLQPTQQENQQSDISTEIQKLNDALAGKAADTTAAYKQLGFGTTTDANGNIVGDADTADLTAKLDTLQKEALAIPQQLQTSVEGRAVTAGGLHPIQTAALRNNAIAALGVSSIISARNGQLEKAKHLVDQLLTQKYGPLEAALKAKTANLELLSKDPKASLADKNRAAAQKAILDKQAADLEVAKQNTKDAQTAVVSIIGANPGLSADIMSQLQKAHSPIEVAQIAAANRLVAGTDKLPASAQEYMFAVKGGYTGTYTDYQNEDANRKQAIAAAGVVTPGAPTSYKEWELAGKPGTYADYLKDTNTKAPTVAQQTVATYAARIEQANPTIDSLTSYVSALNPLQFETMSRMPSYLQSAQYQQYDQAARNFINATLRRESGAVISPSEFDNAYKQYLPRAGDTPATLAEKKKNRDIVYASLRNASGNAYQSVDDLLGTSSTSGSFTSPGGNTYTLPY